MTKYIIVNFFFYIHKKINIQKTHEIKKYKLVFLVSSESKRGYFFFFFRWNKTCEK